MKGLPLRVEDLRLTLSRDTVISAERLEIPPGALTILTGPSGSGKSTLLYLLSGLLAADSGRILWGGTDLAALGEGRRDRWRRANSGFVFQDFHLFEELSPVDNVVASAWFSSFSAARHRGAARARLESLGIPRDRHRTTLLSRGEKQRVAIARALVGEPAVLFADEPTASLDAAAGTQVTGILADLARQEGRTVIVATHDPVLRAEADLIVTLDHGRAELGVPA